MSEMHPAQIDGIMVLPQIYAGNTLHIDHIVQFMVSMVLYFPMPSSIGAGSANACVLCCILLYYTHFSPPLHSYSTSQTCVALETTFAVTAFILMWIGSIRCNFIKFTDTAGTSEPVSLQFGIWYYQVRNALLFLDEHMYWYCKLFVSSMDV